MEFERTYWYLRWEVPGEHRTHDRHRLCLYRRRTIPDVFVPDPTGFPKPHAPVRPYIFTTTDIARLLDAADHLVATSRSAAPGDLRLAIVAVHERPSSRGTRPPDRRRLRPQ